jgi:hypothetical protein
MLALSFGLSLLNMVLIMVVHRYYPYFYSVGAIIGWTGLWLVITGQPKANPDGSKAPMWSRIGLGVAFGFGMLTGASLFFY